MVKVSTILRGVRAGEVWLVVSGRKALPFATEFAAKLYCKRQKDSETCKVVRSRLSAESEALRAAAAEMAVRGVAPFGKGACSTKAIRAKLLSNGTKDLWEEEDE